MPKVAKGLLFSMVFGLGAILVAPAMAQDPEGNLDSAWVVVTLDSGYVVKVELRGTSDNTGLNKIQGYNGAFLISVNKGALKLVDNTKASVFAGSVALVNNWAIREVGKGPGGLDSTVSPYHITIGAASFDTGWTGTDVLLATFRILINGDPDTLTIDTLSTSTISLKFVTQNALEYTPAWTGGGLYYDPLDVKDYKNGNITALPKDYTLNQNFPNPFNATTQIQFDLPKSSHVKLEIFNVLGQKIKTLVDEELQAGYKQVTWDGKDQRGNLVSTGIYFYRIRAENQFTDMRKMLLIK